MLHFADAHIDIANYGRHDPNSLLPVRVMDFLQSLDQIVETTEKATVDPIGPAGDTLKELRQDLAYMLAALRLPVLNYEDIP